jgi:ribonuclease PH
MPVEFALNVLKQADGSARLRMAGNDILVAVHGPSPVKTKQELTDRASLQVSVETLNTPPSIILKSSRQCIEF